ncbi:hypothetical protein [Bradyrhizobium sp. CER78]|uniref:hypothetical protein n=1 Tax=Bradyrhizobium sp. CER78 TaxID=3039162 RepID=UPI002446BB93|nr:hypothetical protein [Bradyrhizobium sp. CER78]MDH2380398.1 hypothetical protein [Bradyrhizobium sp. CER78]
MEYALRLLLPSLFCLVATAAAAKGTFIPPGAKPPDYAITMATGGSFYKSGSQIVVHHGDWTKVAINADSPNVTYYHEDARISVNGSSLVVIRGPEFEELIEYAPRNIGERQIHLGESCTVWEVSRSRPSSISRDSGTIALSCVTDDGIELSQKLLGPSKDVIFSAEATRIERRPVSPEEVQPPASAFALDWPGRDTLPPIPPEKPDHEVVMQEALPPEKLGAIRIVRRHGPWQFTEETAGKLRTIRVISDHARTWFEYASDASGAPKRLIINRYTPPPEEQAQVRALRPQPKRDGGTDTVLGETCSWFNMTPEIFDNNTQSCLTEDGISLKEQYLSRSSHRAWTAIRVVRRPIAIDEIKLAPELLSPQLWGVE